MPQHPFFLHLTQIEPSQSLLLHNLNHILYLARSQCILGNRRLLLASNCHRHHVVTYIHANKTLLLHIREKYTYLLAGLIPCMAAPCQSLPCPALPCQCSGTSPNQLFTSSQVRPISSGQKPVLAERQSSILPIMATNSRPSPGLEAEQKPIWRSCA